MKVPPDKYRTIKISFKKIQRKNVDYNPLISAIFRSHKLTILVYQFLRAFILKQYKDSQEIMHFDGQSIFMAYKCLMKKSKGVTKIKGNNEQILNQFTEFYNKEFNFFINDQDKIDGSYLSQIIAYSCTDILTNIENNIKQHFFKYVKKFVNESFKEENDKILDKLKGNECKEKRKELYKELCSPATRETDNDRALCSVRAGKSAGSGKLSGHFQAVSP